MPAGSIMGTGWECHLGVGLCVTITVFHCRVLCKFAFSLSQDWELPIKREVSRWRLSFSPSARGFTYLLHLPALCSSPSSASRSGAKVRGWGCCPCRGRLCTGAVWRCWQRVLPCPAGTEGSGTPLPSPVLQTTEPLPVLAAQRWEVQKAALSGCWRPQHAGVLPSDTTFPFLGAVH